MKKNQDAGKLLINSAFAFCVLAALIGSEPTRAADDTFLQPDKTLVEQFFAQDGSESEHAEHWKRHLSRPHPTVDTLRRYFREAAQEFDVPTELLEVIGQVENNWTQIGPSIDQGWGIMHLVRNSYCDTLGEAADALGLDPQLLKDDARQNIRGAAALIAQYAGAGKAHYTRLENWFDAVKQFTGLIDDELREMQAERIYQVIRDGVKANTLWGEKVVIEPHKDVDVSPKLIHKKQREEKKKVRGKAEQEIQVLSTDYGPAIWNPADPSNYGTGRNHTIDTWVNHWVGVGTYAGAISWFKTPVGQGGRTKPSSAHFVIRSSDGEITNMVRTADTAWHAGATGYPYNNTRSIGVEHEVTVVNPDQWNSVPMLTASANMARYFCDLEGIPETRSLPGIRGHNEMPGTSTECPGPLPWDTWMSYLIGGQKSDLTIIEPVVVSPASVTPGGTIQVDWTEKNKGTVASSPAHNTKIFLSTSAYGTTYQVGYYGPMNTLGVGATLSYTAANTVVTASIPPGDYYVTVYIDSDSQVSEENDNNNIGSSSPNRVTITQIQQTGSLQVAISPQGAIDAGAQWRVDSGTWRNSGYTQSGLSVGQHTVEFSDVSGWSKPGNIYRNIVANGTAYETGTYTQIQQTGSLQVAISPQGAIDAGAQWRVDSGTWRNSGYTQSGLSVGQHTVEFSDVSGWSKPGNKYPNIVANGTAYETGTYTQIQQTGSLQVAISPQGAIDAGAQWRVDSGTWRNSGYTQSGLSVGQHTVEFSDVSGWSKPGNIYPNIVANGTAYESGTYTQQGSSNFKLPDSGQTQCYNSSGIEVDCAGTGQDGAYNINPMSFTGNGNGTVTDNNTGLMWQQQDDGNTYNWYEASGTYNASYNPTSQDICGALTTGSYTDWRLPSKKELISIVDYSIPYPGPTINPIFTNTKQFWYWSSPTNAGNTSDAWYVYFSYGNVDYHTYKDSRLYVRCVRGGQSGLGNFDDNHDGTITDTSTGLMWQQSEPGGMTWSNALNYCENLELPSGSGQTDWRLPNIKELESITDDTIYNPAIDRNFFPNASATDYWSSTTVAGYPGYPWCVYFYDGYVDGGGNGYYDKGSSLYARCVRGGQSGSLDDCTYNLSHQTNQFTSSGGEDTVTVSASSPNCQWTATESLDWVTITSDTSGTGSGSVSYTVSANSSQSSRTGNMTIAGKNFTINQDSVNSYNLTVNKSGTGTGGITSSPAGINCGSNCGASFNSGAVVSLTATPDTGSTFTGWSGSGCSGAGTCIITMNAGTAVTATFTAETNYTYTVSPTTKSFKAAGGKLTVKVTGVGQNCLAPLVTINDAWLSQSGAISWKNNAGKVKIAIQKNTSSQSRTGVIWIGGNALTIEESGAQCQLTAVKSTSKKFTNAGSTGSLEVIVSPQDCAWNVSTISDWIHLDTTEGTGNGNIVFYVDTNATGKNRTGKIDVSLATNVKKKKTLSLKQNK